MRSELIVGLGISCRSSIAIIGMINSLLDLCTPDEDLTKTPDEDLTKTPDEDLTK